MDPKTILQDVKGIEEVLEKYVFDTVNEEAKHQIFCLAADIQLQTADALIHEKITQIREWAEVLCGGKSHQQYETPQVKEFILGACDGIRLQLRAYRLMT